MLTGQKILVTGGSSGIGYHTALGLSGMGAEILLASRDMGRTEIAARKIEDSTGHTVVPFAVDLSSQAAIRDFAQRVKGDTDHLDVLINNAGALFAARKQSVDGIEMTWALNHLGPFLLTSELMPLLQAAPAARIITVASGAHNSANLNLDDVDYKQTKYRAFPAYAQSKLANIMFTYALARHLAGSTITANCVHPGVVASGFFRNIPLVGGLMSILGRPFMISETQGAETSIHVAASPEGAEVNGQYFKKSRATPSNEASYDEAAQEKLWALSLAQTGLDGF